MWHWRGKRRSTLRIYYCANILGIFSACCGGSARLMGADGPWQGRGEFEADVNQPGRDREWVSTCQGLLWIVVSLREGTLKVKCFK